MRPSVLAALALSVLAAVPGCKKEEAPPPPPPAEAPPPAPAPPPVAEAPPAAEDTMKNDMKNCPSAVAGAETTVKADKKAVTIKIAVKDAALAKDVQARSHALLHGAPPASGEIQHTGGRTGGGAIGKCPVVVPGAKADVKDEKDGVTIKLTPGEGQKVDEIAKSVNDRVAAMPKDGAAADPGAAAPADPAAAPAGAAAPEGEKK